MKTNRSSGFIKIGLMQTCIILLLTFKFSTAAIYPHDKFDENSIGAGEYNGSYGTIKEPEHLCDLNNFNLYVYYADNDNDGFGNSNDWLESSSLIPPSGYVIDNTDCNDNSFGVNPGALELCNNIDDNCDGIIDIGMSLVTGTINGNGSQCVPVVTGSSTFSIAIVPGASSYIWSVPSTMNILNGQGTNSIFVSWTAAAAHDGINDIISVTPNDGCSTGPTSSLPVSINYIAPVRPSSISGPVKLCPGSTAVYSVQNLSRAASYLWTVPTGLTITSGTETNVIEVLVDNLYTGGVITCAASNSCGISPARSRSISLNPAGSPSPITGIKNGVCGLTGVLYSIAALPNATDYVWSVPAGATVINGQGTTMVEVDFAPNFISGAITVTGTNGCGDGTTRSLNLRGAPDNPGNISGDITICNSQIDVQYEVASVPNTSNYIWKVPTGVTITSGQGTKTILVNYGALNASGLQVSVKASNDCGTSFARVLNGITVDPGNCVRFTNSNEIESFEVFPNPAVETATVRISGSINSTFQVRLTDISGRLLFDQTGVMLSANHEIKLPTYRYNSGVYLLRLKNEHLEKTIKLVKQ